MKHLGRDRSLIAKIYKQILFVSIITLISGCALDSPKTDNKLKTSTTITEITSCISDSSARIFSPVKIIDKPIAWSENRNLLISEYAVIHYNLNIHQITPRAIVIHWTASNDLESVYRFFYPESTNDPEHNEFGSLNVTSHFLVGRDGTIYRLTPETALNRHAIGLNWCSIGIENVGGKNGLDNLTDAQLKSNIELIKYLKQKFPDIEYVLGHYQQGQAKQTDLWIEKIPTYYAEKIDPGPRFMKQLQISLSDTKLNFFKE